MNLAGRSNYPLFPRLYGCFAAAAALDAALTGVILGLGGREVNPCAAWILVRAGLGGMIAYKLAVVCVVIAVCQRVGLARLAVGLRLAWFAVAVHLLPLSAAGVALVGYARESHAARSLGGVALVEAAWTPAAPERAGQSVAACSSRTSTSGTSSRRRLMSW